MSRKNEVDSYTPTVAHSIYVNVFDNGSYRLKAQGPDHANKLIKYVEDKYQMLLRIDNDKSELNPPKKYCIRLQEHDLQKLAPGELENLIAVMRSLVRYGDTHVQATTEDELHPMLQDLKKYFNLAAEIDIENSILNPDKTFVIVRK